MGFKYFPSYDSGEYIERNQTRFTMFQAGRHTFDARVGGVRRGSRASGISTEAGIGLVTTR